MDIIKEKFGEEEVRLYEVIDDEIKLFKSIRLCYLWVGNHERKMILKICGGNANIRVTFKNPDVDLTTDKPWIGNLLKDYDGHEFHFTAKKTRGIVVPFMLDDIEVKTTWCLL